MTVDNQETKKTIRPDNSLDPFDRRESQCVVLNRTRHAGHRFFHHRRLYELDELIQLCHMSIRNGEQAWHRQKQNPVLEAALADEETVKVNLWPFS